MKASLLTLLLSLSALAHPSSAQIVQSPSEQAADKTAAETPIGPNIFGVFRGRTPCQDLAELLNAPASEACNKVKCRLILYQDPVTKTPTTYDWAGKIKCSGKWSIIKDAKTPPCAAIYKLETPDPKAFLSFLAMEDRVLFVLNKQGTPAVGNIEFSYTLNRILKK